MVNLISTVNIKPDDWASLLAQAVQSRKKFCGHHAYLIKGNPHTIEAGPLKKGQSQEKLSIHEIIAISNAQFSSLSTSYKKGEINRETFDILSGKISDLTTRLIDARVAKRNQPLKVFGRQICSLISAFTSVFGFSSFKPLKESDIAFQKEIEGDRASLAEAKKLAETLVLEDKRTQIEQLTREIPAVIKQAVDVSKKEAVERWLTKKLVSDLKESTGYSEEAPYTLQFKKDMERNIQFKRKDSMQEIDDETPLPGQKIAQRVHKGAEKINALIKHKKDKRWEKAIQSACTQTSLNAIFDAPILLFSISASTHQWKEEGRDFKAVLTFPEQCPPIQLEVIRNPANQAIQKVNVVVEGALDITRESMDGETKSLESAEAIKGTLHYSMTLDENGAPVIEVTHYALTP